MEISLSIFNDLQTLMWPWLLDGLSFDLNITFLHHFDFYRFFHRDHAENENKDEKIPEKNHFFV